MQRDIWERQTSYIAKTDFPFKCGNCDHYVLQNKTCMEMAKDRVDHITTEPDSRCHSYRKMTDEKLRELRELWEGQVHYVKKGSQKAYCFHCSKYAHLRESCSAMVDKGVSINQVERAGYCDLFEKKSDIDLRTDWDIYTNFIPQSTNDKKCSNCISIDASFANCLVMKNSGITITKIDQQSWCNKFEQRSEELTRAAWEQFSGYTSASRDRCLFCNAMSDTFTNCLVMEKNGIIGHTDTFFSCDFFNAKTPQMLQREWKKYTQYTSCSISDSKCAYCTFVDGSLSNCLNLGSSIFLTINPNGVCNLYEEKNVEKLGNDRETWNKIAEFSSVPNEKNTCFSCVYTTISLIHCDYMKDNYIKYNQIEQNAHCKFYNKRQSLEALQVFQKLINDEGIAVFENTHFCQERINYYMCDANPTETELLRQLIDKHIPAKIIKQSKELPYQYNIVANLYINYFLEYPDGVVIFRLINQMATLLDDLHLLHKLPRPKEKEVQFVSMDVAMQQISKKEGIEIFDNPIPKCRGLINDYTGNESLEEANVFVWLLEKELHRKLQNTELYDGAYEKPQLVQKIYDDFCPGLEPSSVAKTMIALLFNMLQEFDVETIETVSTQRCIQMKAEQERLAAEQAEKKWPPREWWEQKKAYLARLKNLMQKRKKIAFLLVFICFLPLAITLLNQPKIVQSETVSSYKIVPKSNPVPEVQTIPPQAPVYAFISVSALNLRATPTTEGRVLSQLSQNERVQVLEQLDGWTRIRFNTQTGFVRSSYLSASLQPVITAPVQRITPAPPKLNLEEIGEKEKE